MERESKVGQQLWEGCTNDILEEIYDIFVRLNETVRLMYTGMRSTQVSIERGFHCIRTALANVNMWVNFLFIKYRAKCLQSKPNLYNQV